MNTQLYSERDICTKFITPAVKRAGWDEMSQIREEVSFTKGRIIVRGKLVTRGKSKRADYVLYYKPNLPLAIIEAKDNKHSVGDGMQQGLEYAETLDIPFVFSSNGDGLVFHDRTGTSDEIEATIGLNDFPSPKALWAKYCAWKGLTPDKEEIVLQDYYDDGSGKAPRYYQVNAVNAAIEAIAKGQNRILLVMATGTGKTYTAFQIIWRLWKGGRKKRILFLADRNVLEAVHIHRGDFLISRAKTRELVAKCVIVDVEPDKLVLSDKTVRLHLSELSEKKFFWLVNNYAPHARNFYAEEASGTSHSMKNVSRSVIYNLPIPLPPLAEQHRIVARVDELMAVCDRMEAQLSTTQTQSRQLLEAVLQQALSATFPVGKPSIMN